MSKELVIVLRARAAKLTDLGLGSAGLRYDIDLLRRAADRIEALETEVCRPAPSGSVVTAGDFRGYKGYVRE